MKPILSTAVLAILLTFAPSLPADDLPDPARVTAAMRKANDFSGRFDTGYAESFDSYEKLDRTRRHGAEFWQPFLLALLFLLFFEVLLQQRIAGR